jgi:hypothetical protein
MPSKRFAKPTEFKVEFWTCASGKDRKHRNRYYTSAEGMIRAGARWEAKGGDYWCRYWNGLNTWVSATRSKLAPSHPVVQAAEPAIVVPLEPERIRRRGGRSPAQVFSVFGICEATAAEIMLKDGRATRKIPPDEIPDSALFNEFGHKALFAVMVPGEQVYAFNELCKELRA